MSMFSAGIIGIEAGWDDTNARANANTFFTDMKGRVAELQATFATAFQGISGVAGGSRSGDGQNAPQSGVSGGANTTAFTVLTTSANNYASVLQSAASAVGQTASALTQAQANAAGALNAYAQRIGALTGGQMPNVNANGGGGAGGAGAGGGNPYYTFGSWNAATQQNTPLSYNPATNQFFNSNNGMGMAGVGWPMPPARPGGQQQNRAGGANWWIRRGAILAAYQGWSALKGSAEISVAENMGSPEEVISKASALAESNPIETLGKIINGFGIVTPYIRAAKGGLTADKMMSGWVNERMGLRNDEAGQRDQTAIVQTRDAVLHQQLESDAKRASTYREIEAKRTSLFIDAGALADPWTRNAAQQKYDNYLKEIPGMQQAADSLNVAELGRIGYLNAGEISVSNIDRETAQGRSANIGNSLAMKLFENRKSTEKDIAEMTIRGVDPEIIKNRKLTGTADDQFLRDQSVYESGIEASKLAGQSNILDARIGRNPLAAEIRAHAAEANAALAEAKAAGTDVSGYGDSRAVSGVGYEIRRRQGLQDEESNQNSVLESNRRAEQLSSQVSELGFVVSHQPLNAMLSRNFGAAAAATNAENENPNSPGHMDRISLILQRMNLQNQEDTDRFNFDTGQIDIAQGTKARQLKILLANPFNTVGANLAGLVGQTELAANDYVKDGRQKEAAGVYKNAILQAEVEKADYLKSFGFIGIDPRYIGGSTDETANPGMVLKEISDTIAGLSKVLTDGIANGFKQVVDQGN